MKILSARYEQHVGSGIHLSWSAASAFAAAVLVCCGLLGVGARRLANNSPAKKGYEVLYVPKDG